MGVLHRTLGNERRGSVLPIATVRCFIDIGSIEPGDFISRGSARVRETSTLSEARTDAIGTIEKVEAELDDLTIRGG